MERDDILDKMEDWSDLIVIGRFNESRQVQEHQWMNLVQFQQASKGLIWLIRTRFD